MPMSVPSLNLPSLNWGRSKAFWISLGLVAWLYFVISHIPAAWGAWLLTRGGDLAITGPTGTLWNGRASLASIKIKGVDHSLGQVSWTLDVLPLFMLKACGQVNAQMDNQQFEGYVCGGRNGAVSVKGGTATFPATLLQQLLPLAIEGEFSLQLDTLEMKGNQLGDLRGKLSWQAAKIYNGSNWMTLGAFGADLVDDDKNGLSAHIFDVMSAAHVDLVLALTAPSGGFLRGGMKVPESFVKEANAGAWLAMFAQAQPVDAEGNISYALDVGL